MKIDNEIGTRLKALRECAQLSQAALAQRCGWASQSRVGNYESGTRKISAEDAIVLGKALNVSPAELLFGDSGHGNVSYAGPNKASREYPLISWVSAGQWAEAIEPYKLDEIEDWPETTENCSEGSFWLKVQGDSMTSPVGLSIPEGMIILVDPAVEPTNGKLVVAKLINENEATFKKLVIDAGQKYLKPLNSQYGMIPINGNCRIIGVVVDAKVGNLP